MQEMQVPSLGWKDPGGGNGNPLQCSCLGNPMDREARWATVHPVTKESDTTGQVNNNDKKAQRDISPEKIYRGKWTHERCLTPLAIRETQIKTTAIQPSHTYYNGANKTQPQHQTLARMQKNWLTLSYTAGGDAKPSSQFRNGLAVSYKTKHATATQLSNCTLGHLSQIHENLCLQKTCIRKSTEDLFIIGRNWKQPKCPPKGRWSNGERW